MKRKFMNFLDKLSREEMRTIMGGYGDGGYRDNPLWGGERWYNCNCSSGGAGPFTTYMGTSGDFMDMATAECGSGNHMTCSY